MKTSFFMQIAENQSLRNTNQLSLLALVVFISLIVSACNLTTNIHGEYSVLKRHVKGVNLSADSQLVMVDSNYFNNQIFENTHGKSYRFESSTATQLPDIIFWNNKWFTIVMKESSDNKSVFYTFDIRNHLRALNIFSEKCNCFIYKSVFNKNGKLTSFYNKGLSF